MQEVASADEAADMAHQILDPARTTPIVGVSVAADRDVPLVDVDLLRAAVGLRADVRLLRTGPATWELKRRLPQGFDVYGDAARIWQPGLGFGDAAEHPILLLAEGPDAAGLAARISDLALGGTHREYAAIVTEVESDRAMVRLADGTPAHLERSQASRWDLPLERVLRPAQRLRVLLVADATAEAPARASLLAFEPDPRRRVVEELGPGTVLLGRSVRTRGGVADVELLPGVLAPLKEHAATASAGDLVTVRVLRADERVIEVVPIDDGDAMAASIFEDGPPWLSAEPIAFELPAVPDLDTTWRSPAPEDERRAAGGVGDSPSGDIHDVNELADLVGRALRAHEDSQRLIAGADDLVLRLRRAAGELRHELEVDLLKLRDRVLRTVEDERDQLEGSTLHALEEARAETARLREMLGDAASERDRLQGEVADLMRTETSQREQLQSAHTDARRYRERAEALQRELDSYVPAAERFVTAIRQSWLRNTTKEDRRRFPWREPIIGPGFLNSLDRIEGISQDRVLDVCAEVACGRAVVRSGLQVHALRAHASGGSAQRVREDGARAFRASLQVRSAAARRLHYWELPDGGIELANIGYHDDFGIA